MTHSPSVPQMNVRLALCVLLTSSPFWRLWNGKCHKFGRSAPLRYELCSNRKLFSPVRATFCDDDAHFEFKRRSFPLSLRHIIQELSSSWAQRSAEARQHVWPPARPRRWRRPSSWCFISDTENHTSPSYPARPACLPSRWHLRAMSLVPPPPPLRVDTEIVI